MIGAPIAVGPSYHWIVGLFPALIAGTVAVNVSLKHALPAVSHVTTGAAPETFGRFASDVTVVVAVEKHHVNAFVAVILTFVEAD